MSNHPPVKIGEAWPDQGGIFAGTLRTPKAGDIYHVIMHPEAAADCEWGKFGKKIDGAADYWDGATNTAAMHASGKCTDIINAIAALPPVDGHTDYHLPAQAELNLLCCNLRDMLPPEYHWSSTQYSAYSAWTQLFEHGYQDFYYKDDTLAVRAVRRILAI